MRKESSPDNGKHTLAEFALRVVLIYPAFAAASYGALLASQLPYLLLIGESSSTAWGFAIGHMLITFAAGLLLAPLLAATEYEIGPIFLGCLLSIFVGLTFYYALLAYRGEMI